MITQDRNWTLKAKLGEAGTDVDFVICYKIPRYGMKPDAGRTRADSEEVITAASSGTSAITLLSPPPPDERRRCQVFICNKGASAHTIYLYLSASVDRYILNGYSLPGNSTVSVNEDGSVSMAPTADHGQLAGLADDDHAQYALLAGRGGGQTLYGSTATNQQLLLRGNSFDSNGGLVNLRRVFLADNSADPSAVGDLNRNNTGHASLLYHDGSAVRRVALLANSAPVALSLPYFDGTIWQPSSALGAGKVFVNRSSAMAAAYVMQHATRSGGGTVSAIAADENMAVISVDASAGNTTVPLPAVSGNAGLMVVVMKTDSSANTVTIDANASETINGALTNVLNAQYSYVKLFCTGSVWLVLGAKDFLPVSLKTTTAIPGATGAWGYTTLTQVLSAGEWVLDANVDLDANGATAASFPRVAITTSSSGTPADLSENDNTMRCKIATDGIDFSPVTIAGYRVRLTAVSTTYTVAIQYTFLTASPRYRGRLSARRVG